MIAWNIDRFKGEITTGGGSIPTSGGATMPFTIQITSGSTIRKAYLMASRNGVLANTSPCTVTLTGATPNSYTFNSSNVITPPTITTSYGGASNVHIIDITAAISPSVTNYILDVPVQGSTFASNRYTDFMLVVTTNNNAMDIINTGIFLNDQNSQPVILQNFSLPIPLDNTFAVALGLFCGYLCNSSSGDGETIKVNGTNLTTNNSQLGSSGSFAGNNSCGGAGYDSPRGNFHYKNGVLTALANCNANQAMGLMDALSDIKALVSQGATAFNMNFNTATGGNYTNNFWGAIVAYKDQIPPPFPFECAAPTPSMSLITQTTARVSWISGAPCGGVNADYNVQYRQVGSTTWTVVPVSLVLLYDIVGLTAITTYEVQIVPVACGAPPAVCAPSSIIDFTTLP